MKIHLKQLRNRQLPLKVLDFCIISQFIGIKPLASRFGFKGIRQPTSPISVSKRLRSATKINPKPVQNESGKKLPKHENLELASEVKKRDAKAIEKATLDELIKVPFAEINRTEKILEPETIFPKNTIVKFNNLDAISTSTPNRGVTGKSSVASCNISLLQSINNSGKSTPKFTPYKMMRMNKENTQNNIDRLEFKIQELEKAILMSKNNIRDDDQTEGDNHNDFIMSQFDQDDRWKENFKEETKQEITKQVLMEHTPEKVTQEIESKEKPELIVKPPPAKIESAVKSNSKAKLSESKLKTSESKIKCSKPKIIKPVPKTPLKDPEVIIIDSDSEDKSANKFEQLDSILLEACKIIHSGEISEHKDTEKIPSEPDFEEIEVEEESPEEPVPVIQK